MRILEEADRCAGTGEVGQLLRREGLYSSHLANWRKARDEGARYGLRSKKRGVKPKASNLRISVIVNASIGDCERPDRPS